MAKHNGHFKPGQSGNPSGRPRLDPDVRSQIQSNGMKGIQRLSQLLNDDLAFGQDGWLSGKEQIAVAALAMDRAFGRSQDVSVTHTHSGTVGLQVSANKMKDIAERLPERIAQQKTIEEAEYTEVDGILEERQDE